MRQISDEEARKKERRKNLVIPYALGGKGTFSLSVFISIMCQGFHKENLKLFKLN